MSTSGRRNPLDRLAPVGASDPAAGGDRPMPTPRLVEPAQPAEAREEPGWGIGGMPGWLDDGSDDNSRRNSNDDGHAPEYDDEEPDETSVVRRRFAVAPPAALALIAIGVIACAIAGFGLFRGTDSAPVVAFETSAGPTVGVSTPAAAHPTVGAQLVVSVVGLVHRPGLVRLPPGARVADAIASAGGARRGADTVSLNLAQLLNDGDQILVGYAGPDGRVLRSAVVAATGSGAPPANEPRTTSGAPSAAPSGSSGSRVNLNTATEDQLDALPGVGPVTARAIIDWRTRNGRFTSVDQLGEVDGIGPARLAKLRDLVTV